MNSEPSLENGTAVAPNAARVTTTTAQRPASASRSTGRYSARSSHESGLNLQRTRRGPRIQQPTSTGTSVMESRAAAAMA